MSYISTEEQMELFPHLYDGYVPKVHGDWADWETPASGIDKHIASAAKDPNIKTMRDLDKALGTNVLPTVPVQPIEIDENLGLELVPLETIESKYNVRLDPLNGFHNSLKSFFDKTGFLTPKQLNALRKI